MRFYIEAEAGGYLFRGFKGILFYDAGVQYIKVGHWCPRESYNIMAEAGYLVEEPGTAGHTFLSTAESGPTSWNDAPQGWVYSQFEVRTKDIMKAGTDEWFQAIHPTNPKKYLINKILKQGGELTPRIRNISPILKTK